MKPTNWKKQKWATRKHGTPKQRGKKIPIQGSFRSNAEPPKKYIPKTKAVTKPNLYTERMTLQDGLVPIEIIDQPSRDRFDPHHFIIKYNLEHQPDYQSKIYFDPREAQTLKDILDKWLNNKDSKPFFQNIPTWNNNKGFVTVVTRTDSRYSDPRSLEIHDDIRQERLYFNDKEAGILREKLEKWLAGIKLKPQSQLASTSVIKTVKACDLKIGQLAIFTPPADWPSLDSYAVAPWYGQDKPREFNDKFVEGEVIKINPTTVRIKQTFDKERWNYGHEYIVPKEAEAVVASGIVKDAQ